MAPIDALAMMGDMGFGDQLVGQAIPEMQMLAAAGGVPRVNPTQYAQGYEIRRSLRQGLIPPRVSTRGGMTHGGVGAPMPYPSGGMDASSLSNPDVANQALQPFGLQLPTHTNPFLFFQDQNAQGEPTWAGRHPKVAKAIEGAMIGATTPDSATTTGESISNVARTVLGIPGLYRQSQAAQMQAPFDMARQIAAVQADHAQIQSHLATAFHAYATGSAALDKPAPEKAHQLFVDPQGKAWSFDTGTGKMAPSEGAPEGGFTRPGTAPKPTPPGKAALPDWVGKSAAKQNAYFEYKAQGGEFNEDTTPTDQKAWSQLVTKHTSLLAGATAGAGAGARRAVDVRYGQLSDSQKAELRPLEKDLSAAEQGLAQVDKLRPSQLASYPGDDPKAQRESARAAAQQKLTAAQKAHQDKLDSFKTPQYDSQGNRK